MHLKSNINNVSSEFNNSSTVQPQNVSSNLNSSVNFGPTYNIFGRSSSSKRVIHAGGYPNIDQLKGTPGDLNNSTRKPIFLRDSSLTTIKHSSATSSSIKAQQESLLEKDHLKGINNFNLLNLDKKYESFKGTLNQVFNNQILDKTKNHYVLKSNHTRPVSVNLFEQQFSSNKQIPSNSNQAHILTNKSPISSNNIDLSKNAFQLATPSTVSYTGRKDYNESPALQSKTFERRTGLNSNNSFTP